MLSNPNVDAADTGVDPSTGRYLTKKERVAVFKKRKIKAGSVFNRKSSSLVKVSGIKGGPLAKYSPSEGAGNTGTGDNKLISKLTVQVQNNSKKITLLKNIVKLNIEKVTKVLNSNVEQEKKQQKEDLRQQKIDDDSDRKKKKEGLLERVGKSVGKSLLKPVEKVGNTVKGILGRLGDAFMALFMGFIANKAIKMIQAHMSGDTETFKQLRNTIIKSVAVVGGIFLILNGGLMALPGIISGIISTIVSLGGAMMAFMASPAGLIALGIAAGIGVLFALKKGVDAATTKAAGGVKFKEKFDALKGPLAEAGITVKGSGKKEKFYIQKRVKSGKRYVTKYNPVDTHGTPEQKEMLANYIVERDRVIDLRDRMRAEMEAKKSELKGSMNQHELRHGDYNKEAAKEELKIRKQYEAQIDGTTQTQLQNNIQSNENKLKKEITQLDEKGPNIIDMTSSSGGNGSASGGSGKKATSLQFISSSDNNAHKLFSEMEYNIMGVRA